MFDAADRNIQIPKTPMFSSDGGTSRGLAPLTPPFKQGVRSSNLRRVTTSSRTALVRDGFFIQKAISHLFRRSSFPKCKHFIGLHFGFSSNA